MSATNPGWWAPSLAPKQMEVFNTYQRYLLVSGPKQSGKTIALVHKLVRHAFDTDRARVGIFARTMKVAKDGGIWADLTDLVLPQWIEGIGLEMLTETAVDPETGAVTVLTAHDPDTRQPYVVLRNRWGTPSRIVMNSLDYEGDVEALVKGKRFSMVVFNELSNFRDRRVFDFTADALRCPWLEWKDHQWVADTNPSDEGTQSWIYRLWYETLQCDPESVEDAERRRALLALRPNLGLVEIRIEDNPWLTPQQRRDMLAKFGHDPDLAARYLDGRWVRATHGSVFADVFRPALHVVGDTSAPDPSRWTVLVPEEGATEMVTGWDIGAVNHAVVVVEPFRVRGEQGYKVLAEVVSLGRQIRLEELVEQVMETMDQVERDAGRKLIWRHWSDRSAFDAYRPSAERFDHMIVEAASAGRILLRAAPKFSGSVAQALRMMRRLLHEERLYVSAQCEQVAEMFRSLRCGRTPFGSVDRASPHKHVFDALGYVLLGEMPPLVEDRLEPARGRPGSLVSLGGLVLSGGVSSVSAG